MNTFIYASNDAELERLAEYANKHFYNAQIMREKLSLTRGWHERTLKDLLNLAVKGDMIVVWDALNLARSHLQVLHFLDAALAKEVQIQFIKYALIFTAQPVSNFMDLVNLVRHIENDFVLQRNAELLMKRKELGITLGRPKGRQSDCLKLDEYKGDINRYMKLSISKAAIAKLVDCHPQTLYKWLERNTDKV